MVFDVQRRSGKTAGLLSVAVGADSVSQRLLSPPLRRNPDPREGKRCHYEKPSNNTAWVFSQSDHAGRVNADDAKCHKCDNQPEARNAHAQIDQTLDVGRHDANDRRSYPRAVKTNSPPGTVDNLIRFALYRSTVGHMKPRQRVSALTMLGPVLLILAAWFTLMSNPSSAKTIASVVVACVSFGLFVWAFIRYVRDRRRFG